jgi:hypothetical protein
MGEQSDKKRGTPSRIAADGDVILVVGLEMVKLHVRSLFLKAVSKPFSTMFEPGWKEGDSMLERDEPVEISLPEDSAWAMKIICAIISYRNKRVPHTLPAGNVLDIAVTTDKHDCVDAQNFASQT